MLQAERQSKILKIIRERGFVTNKELQEIFKVTPITIRRDIKELSKQNLIKQVHGGAVDITESGMKTTEPFYKTKLYLNVRKKQAIGKLAAEFIDNGDTIMLDSGTTTMQIALQIKKKRFENLSVLTNDIKISNELCDVERIKVFVLGGELRKSLYSLSGPFTVNFLKDLKADKLFLAADAISKNNGISNANIEDVPIKQAMIENSAEVILVADSTKFGKDAFCRVCGWDKINRIITDDSLKEEYRDFFKEINIECQICVPISKDNE